MKTKVNEIPFVGPKGRKELIERVKELEKQVLELAKDSVDSAKILVIPNFYGSDIEASTKEEFCSLLGITTQQFDALISGKYAFVKFPNVIPSETYIVRNTSTPTAPNIYFMEVGKDPEGAVLTAYAQMVYYSDSYSIIEY